MVLSSQEAEQNDGSLIWIRQFDEESAQRFAEQIIKIAHADQLQPITIYVDSYGGDIYGLRTMLSVMDSVINPLITVTTGKAMSAGAVLLSHGDIRCVGKHGSVMIHETSVHLDGHIEDLNHDAREAQLMNKHLIEVLAKNCKKTVKQLKKMWKERRDIYLNPVEAVKFGIADKVGVPTIFKRMNYELNFLEHPGQ
jgi:ATP-dependent Clp protease protease subunit